MRERDHREAGLAPASTGDGFPFKRELGQCELCGRFVGEHKLRWVVLRAGHAQCLPRGIYVCDRHEEAM